jgi:PAS domain S-box-containing protein
MKIALIKTRAFRLLMLGVAAALLLLGGAELGFRQLHQDQRRSLAELNPGPDFQPSRVRLVTAAPRLPGRPEPLMAAWFRWEGPTLTPAAGRAPFRGGQTPELPLHRFPGGPVFWLGGLGALCLLAGLALVRRYSHQVATLIKAAQAFNAGNLDYRIPHTGEDEMGLLASTLNHMAAGLKETTVSRAEWENTFNVIPDQILVLDNDQRIVRLNRAAAVYFRTSPEEAAGRFCYELMHGRSAAIDSCPFVKAKQSGAQSQLEFCCAANGRSFLVTVDPWRDPAGEIKGAVHVARDITAFKNIEAELASTSQFLNQIVESTPVALVVVNRQGLFVRVNPQFFHEYGFSAEEILGRHYSMVYANEEEVHKVIGELREQGQILSRVTSFRHKSGRPVPTRISIRKLWGKNGELLGSVAVGRNISDEVSLQRQLEQAQKLEAIATLSGGLAHNFNNQLSIIMGLTNLMLSKVAPNHEFYHDLQEIEQQVQAGQELTQKLLAFARSAAFKLQSLNLNDLVKVTVDMFARTRRDLVVAQELSPGDLPVKADVSQIQQVLMNLLINAWQAMPGGGRITIATRTVSLTEWTDPAWDIKPGDYGVLAVTDTGVGMDEAVLSRIFEPFFTIKKPGQGTGLGLASAYRIIKDHGGAMRVKSQSGQGSTFTIYLPRSASPAQVLPVPDHRLIPGHATVLVVDDEPVLRRVCARLLNKLGYQALEAAGGEEALRVYREQGPKIDLVLLDLIMPGLNGIQTLERLREMDPDVRVLLCSGYGDKAGENLSADVEFIAKPYTLEFLSQKVAAVLAG